LTKDYLYKAKVDSNRDLRVKNDKGRWSKYSITNFRILVAGNRAILELLKEHSAYSVERQLVKDMTHLSIIDEHGKLEWYRADDTTGYMHDLLNAYEKDRTADDFTISELGYDNLREVIISDVRYIGEPVLRIWDDPTRINEKMESTKSKHVEERVVEATPTTKPKEKEKETMSKKPTTLREYLENEGVPKDVINSLANYRSKYTLDDDQLKDRIPRVSTLYQGGKVLTAAITALLEGQHILLQGAKATGKNVLANNLAFFFGRPLWDISFHVNMDASSLIGAETFRNNEVEFRPGSVYNCAIHGGFGVLDEVNMAKNEAMAVLHSVTDDRRIIDVPGYDRITLHPATQFIATMNYGYAGTRELNEAFASRFVVIHVPELDEEGLQRLLVNKFPEANKTYIKYYVRAFNDLQRKAKNAEISTKAVDLRGIIAAIKMTKRGMSPYDAMEVNIINKCFDQYERDIVADTVSTSISKGWNTKSIFPDGATIEVDFSEMK
jgi:MoxR-like ATPase